MAQKQKYDLEYALAHGTNSFKEKKEQRIIQLLGDIEGKSILEIGSNTGEFCNELLKKKAKPAGIDINEEAIRIAKQRFPLISFTAAPIEKFSSEKKFDIIIAIDVIEHLKEPEIMLKKVSSLLKKNGVLAVSTGNWWDYIGKFLCMLNGEQFIFDETHEREYNPIRLRNEIEKNCFKIKKSVSWPFPIVWRIYNNANFGPFGMNLIILAERKMVKD